MQIESLADIWQAVCNEVRGQINEIAFNVWIKDLHPVELKAGSLTLAIYSDYKKQIVEANYIDLLKDALKQIMGISIDVYIVLEDENGILIKDEPLNLNEQSFEKSFTFDNFIVGSSNRFAHAASMAVADNPSLIYNPLVIYGTSGVGKTHLLYAIKNHLSKKYPAKSVVCVRSEDFTNQLINAIHDGDIEQFRLKFRNADVFLIDDVQFIAGKEQTQEEFFNTFNTLFEKNKQIVVTLDRPPRDIKTLDDRIRSRFESGLFADITPPDFETRVGIIRTKAELLGISIEDNIVHYIAEHITMNTRQLEGVVKKLQAYIKIQNAVPTISVAQGFIRDIINDTQPEPIKIEKIITEVARTYNVTENDILSNRRTAELAIARQISMYIARETTELSYKAIGESFGKDHATALYSCRKIEKLIKENSFERDTINDIIKNLKSE